MTLREFSAGITDRALNTDEPGRQRAVNWDKIMELVTLIITLMIENCAASAEEAAARAKKPTWRDRVQWKITTWRVLFRNRLLRFGQWSEIADAAMDYAAEQSEQELVAVVNEVRGMDFAETEG